MANVFTGMDNDIYTAAQRVGREKIGGVMSVRINSDANERVAYNHDVKSMIAPKPTVNTTYSPSMTIPEGDDQTFTNKTLTLDKYINVQIPWTGEDIRDANNNAGYETLYGLQLEQAMRQLANQVESDLMGGLKNGAGNAVGTSGTTPFASNFDLIADALKLMEDRGLPFGELGLVLDNAAANNLRKIDALWQVNTSGDEDLLRQAVLGELYGAMIRQSGQVASHTIGTASGYLVNNGAGYSADDTSIVLDTGTGTIVTGDIVTFGGDTERYVVGTGIAAPGTITLNSGLFEAIADNEAVALQSAYTGNIMLHRDAAELVIRPPQQPNGGDAAVDRRTVRDPISGLIFELAAYKGYNKSMIDISVMYGYEVWNPDFACIIQG